MANVFFIYHPGLNTDPYGDCCGARPHFERLAAKYAARLLVLAWDDPHCYAMTHATMIPGWTVLLAGHSHGAWRARETQKTLDAMGKKLDALAFIDLCPWGNPFEQLGPPEPFPTCRSGYACWQGHPRLFMPNGVKFLPRQENEVDVDDVTPFTDPALGHIDWTAPPFPPLRSIAGDARVWGRIESAFDRVVFTERVPEVAETP